MSEEKLLTVREVATFLGITEKEVLDLAENASIPAYKLAGLYLRFKKEQVEEYKKNMREGSVSVAQRPRFMLKEQILDFFYFNDFYILAGLLIIILGVIIYRGL